MPVKKVFRLRLSIMLDIKNGVQVPDTVNIKESKVANLVEQRDSTFRKNKLEELQYLLGQLQDSNNHHFNYQKYELNHK